MAVRKLLVVCIVLLTASCASGPSRKDELFMEQLGGMLAGSYDNLAQSRGSPDHAPVRLVIAPVQSLQVGEHVFYVQEMAADDARRVLAQRLYVLNMVPGNQMAVLTQADFAEPLRWRDGHLNRSLFHSLLMKDLRLRPGCDLTLKKDAAGYTGTMTGNCRGSARDTGEALRVEQRMTLNADGIAIFEQHRDAAGKLVLGDTPDPWYRYARRADAPW